MNCTILYLILIIVVLCGIYHLYCSTNKNIIEGATSNSSTTEYTDPGLSQNPLYLATINASNIAYLKSRMDEITSIKTTVDSMNEQVESNSAAIQSINSSLENAGASATPSQSDLNDMVDSGTTSTTDDTTDDTTQS